MKYLELRDQDMHTRAKAQIKECYEKNKEGDPNFKSLTTSLKARLKQTVGDVYWKVRCCYNYRNTKLTVPYNLNTQKAHDYFDHFFRQKKGGQGGTIAGGH